MNGKLLSGLLLSALLLGGCVKKADVGAPASASSGSSSPAPKSAPTPAASTAAGGDAHVEGASSTPGDAPSKGFATGSSGAPAPGIVAGRWKVDPAFAEKNKNMPPVGFMTGFASTFWYEFAANGTFKGSMSTGSYRLSGASLSMTTTQLNGSPVKATRPQMTGRLTKGGRLLTLFPRAAGQLPEPLRKGIPMTKQSP